MAWILLTVWVCVVWQLLIANRDYFSKQCSIFGICNADNACWLRPRKLDFCVVFGRFLLQIVGTCWRSCFRYYATNQNVAVSISDSVIGIFLGHNHFDLTMALGSTQLLTVKGNAVPLQAWSGP